MYGSQLNKSEKFKELAKCICINITAFDYTGKQSGYSRSVIKDADTNETYKGMDDLEIFFIELPRRDAVGDDRLKKWMTLLSSKSWEEMERNAKGDEIMTQVYEQAREIAQNESMRIAIHNREKFLIGQNSLKEEGREEGEIIGALKANLATANRLLDMGFPIEQVIQATELSEEAIQTGLKKDNVFKRR